ncbi:probable splicing factor 3A subunit 1, partial [Tanacetum coccineum]
MVGSLKDRIAQAYHVPANKQKLISLNADDMEDNLSLAHYNIFISADDIKSFLLIMFLLVMFSFLLTEIESAGHVLVSADRDRIYWSYL